MTDNKIVHNFIVWSDKMSEQLKLKNQICFKHYVISKEIIKKYRPYLEPLNLTYTGYITMLALWETDGMSVKALSNALYLDSGTLTPLLKKLENKNYIKRQRDAHDERVVMVHLTKEGKALKKKAESIPSALAKDVFPNKIDEASLNEHIKALDDVMKLLTSKSE